MFNSWEVWEGDLFLYTVYSEYEADEQREAGFTVINSCVAETQQSAEDFNPFDTVNS
jgi:hypothetical protein